MHLAFPFRINSAGFAAEAASADHVEQMMEQLLFTRPGERVNLPEFGCGVQSLVFGPVTVELAAALRARIESDLQRWLSALIELQSADVSQDEATLTIHVSYVLIATGERRARTFRL